MSNTSITEIYQNPAIPVEEKVKALVSQMTLDEKISQLNHSAPSIERLGVPAYNWWNECLHGVGRAGIATVFPQAIGLAASWNVQLMNKVASTIADEARAKHHDAIRNGMRDWYRGLTFWTPNINIFRDPRWGRGQETYGEDPYLTSRMGVEFVKGLQGDHPHYFKLIATPKHYAVHSGPEAERHSFNATADERDMRMTYLPAFEATIREARAFSIMGAYNRTNGEACCASPTLLEKILRNEWGFEGYVVSDCGAIADIYEHHKIASSPAEAAAMAVKAGCDLCCGNTYTHLKEAVEKGYITEEQITLSVIRLFTARFLLGMFDPEEIVPYAHIPISVNDSEPHRELATQAARESIVLLKNNQDILPLSKSFKKIAVIGPNANDPVVLLGNYHGTPSKSVTPLQGIVNLVGNEMEVGYAKGCGVVNLSRAGFPEALHLAETSDLVIFFGGLSQAVEGEEGQREGVEGGGHSKGDRDDIILPGVQEDLIKQIYELNKKIILVLLNGSAVAINWAQDNLPAILCAWYPGEEGGTAIAEVLFGKYNPAGRLPITFYRTVDDLPPFDDYSMKNRTYRYFSGTPLYPFGFGLSYTRFQYQNLQITTPTISKNGNIELRVSIKNIGKMAGDEVVQVYSSKISPSFPAPVRQLVGFKRISIKPGETALATFSIPGSQLSVIDDKGNKTIESGTYVLSVGGRQPELTETHDNHKEDIIFATFDIR